MADAQRVPMNRQLREDGATRYVPECGGTTLILQLPSFDSDAFAHATSVERAL